MLVLLLHEGTNHLGQLLQEPLVGPEENLCVHDIAIHRLHIRCSHATHALLKLSDRLDAIG